MNELPIRYIQTETYKGFAFVKRAVFLNWVWLAFPIEPCKYESFTIQRSNIIEMEVK